MDELEPSNVVSLPASPHLFRCGLCSLNIEENIKETMVPPRVFSIPESEEKIWICGSCWTLRNDEVYRVLYARYASPLTEKQKNVSLLLRGDKPLYKIYESSRANALGEKLRLTSWKNGSYGIASVAAWVRGETERLLMYNATGSRLVEHNVAVEYISKQYEKECGLLEEKESGNVKISGTDSPWFRIQLLTLDCTFALYERGDSVGFMVGISEVRIPRDSFLELVPILSSVSSFLRTGTSEGDLIRPKKGNLIERQLSCGREVSVTGSGEIYTIRLGETYFKFPAFDLADLGLGCAYFRDVLMASPSSKQKLVERNRKQRYLWLHALGVPVTFKMIMRDFGWFVAA